MREPANITTWKEPEKPKETQPDPEPLTNIPTEKMQAEDLEVDSDDVDEGSVLE